MQPEQEITVINSPPHSTGSICNAVGSLARNPNSNVATPFNLTS